MNRICSLCLRVVAVFTLLGVQLFNGSPGAIPVHAQAGICQQPASIKLLQTAKLIYPIDLHYDQATSQYVGTNSDGKTPYPATAQVSIDSAGNFRMGISVKNGYTGSYYGKVTGGTVQGTYNPGPGFGPESTFQGTVSGCISAPPTPTPARASQECVPGDVSGTWQTQQGNNYHVTFVLQQSGTTIAGTGTVPEAERARAGYTSATGTVSGTLIGNLLDVTVTFSKPTGPLQGRYVATIVDGQLINGTAGALDLSDRANGTAISWDGRGPCAGQLPTGTANQLPSCPSPATDMVPSDASPPPDQDSGGGVQVAAGLTLGQAQEFTGCDEERAREAVNELVAELILLENLSGVAAAHHCWGGAVSLGSTAKYRDAASIGKVTFEVAPSALGDNIAKWKPASGTNVILLQSDPANVPDSQRQDFARTLWHELTHELEDENGDSSDPRIAQLKSAGQPIERFNERNAWYMEEAYSVLTVQVSLFEQNLANGDPPAKLQAQWANVRKAFQDLAQPSDRLPPDVDKIQQWTGFRVNLADLEAYYRAGNCGAVPPGVF